MLAAMLGLTAAMLRPALMARSRRVVASAAPLSIYTSEVCVGHDPGMRFGKPMPEQPARLANLLRALRGEWAAEFGELLRVCEPAADAACCEEMPGWTS